jgi:hypothetical protein
MHAHAGSTKHDKRAQARRTGAATSGSCRSTPAGMKVVCDKPAWALATSTESETDALSSAKQRGVSLLCRHTDTCRRMHTPRMPAFVRVARERIRVCGCLLLSLHACLRACACMCSLLISMHRCVRSQVKMCFPARLHAHTCRARVCACSLCVRVSVHVLILRATNLRRWRTTPASFGSCRSTPAAH